VLRKILCLMLLLVRPSFSAQKSDYFTVPYGQLLPGSTEQVGLWWASSGWKISRTRQLPEETSGAIVIRAARNEAEAAQLVVRPRNCLNGFIGRAEALTGPDGAIIPAENVEVLRVRYVDIKQSTDGWSISRAVEPATGDSEAGLWPDPLPPFRGTINLAANENQPLWVCVKVPRQVPAGIYEGSIALTAKNYSAKVPLQVEVYDFTLPDRMTCTTAFGFWESNVFKYHKLSDPGQQREVLDKYWCCLSAHHISPYHPAPLDPYKVTWPEITDNIKPEEIKPTFDWTDWDKAMDKAINYYHFNSFRLIIPGLGTGRFHSIGKPELLGFAEDTPQYKAAFCAYCRELQEHLRQKGWLDEAFAYPFDEPKPEDYEFVMNGFRKLKETAPDIKRMLTEHVTERLIGGPDIWCPITYQYNYERAQERRKYGEKFWWYICCGPGVPHCTEFIDHPGTEPRVWLWQSWQNNIEGILIWQTNYWTTPAAYPDPNHPQNPYEDPMSWRNGAPKGVKQPWGNGDGRYVYPPEAAADGRPAEPVLDGPVETIRLEMLRDGIEDYEYLAILKRLLKDKANKLTAEQHREYSELLEVPDNIIKKLTNFTKDPAPIEAQREKIARAIAKLGKIREDSVDLPNGYTVQAVKRVEVAVNPERNFHGPSVVRATNGDLLLTHQDSLEHRGIDCYIHQWRSTDNGFTWQDEGVAVDWRDKGIDARHAEHCVTEDGKLVMVVQLVDPNGYGGNRSMMNNVYYISDNNGKTWQYRGEVDPTDKYAVLAARSMFSHDGIIYFGAYSRHQGNALYVSTDNARSWQRRSVIFPANYPDFADLPEGGPPYYPHVMFLNDGTLLAMCYCTPPENSCYVRTSRDQGCTWGPVNKHPELQLWAPRMGNLGDAGLIVTGRSINDKATAAMFSTDNGRTWGHKMIIDKPKIEGNYAYTDIIEAGDNKFWVFTSSPLSKPHFGDVLGVLLEVRKHVR
jgi:succinate dehydrogenase flavin-adding protein (antitoxin of CptAB toxin-antitoxin module)